MIRFYAFVTFCLFHSIAQAQIPVLEIWEIQGNSISSPFEDSLVISPENIVTLVRDDRFFIQTPPERSDNIEQTSDGIMVYTGQTPNVAVGDLITVQGVIQEYFDLTEFGPDDLIVTIDSTQVTLPPAIALDSTYFPKTNEVLPPAERFEGMRIYFETMRINGPSDDGRAYASFSEERTFREPSLPFVILPEVFYIWDFNPELLSVNTMGTGVTQLSIGMEIAGLGVLSYENGRYQIFAASLTSTGDPILSSVRTKDPMEATIGSLNCFVFSNQAADFSARRYKLAQYIIQQLQAPDILAVQEVRDLATLEALAEEITLQAPDIAYQAYLEPGNQGGSFQINNGFLVRNTVSNVQISQWAADEMLSLGGLLHDRPPLLLEGELNTDPPSPVRVLNLHLRSLGGIEGSNADYVRTKRWEQSISVAGIMRDLQYDNLIVLGDFNAFQFSDGYVDVLAQLTGTPTTGAEYPVAEGIIDFEVTNHSALLPQEESYSFVFRGNSQILDHCLTNELTGMSVSELQYARGNADNPNQFVNNTFVPYRASDHDGLVLYLSLEDSLSLSVAPDQMLMNEILLPNPFSAGDAISISLERPTRDMRIELIDGNGRVLVINDLGDLPAGNHSLLPNWNVPPGWYLARLSDDQGTLVRKVIIQ